MAWEENSRICLHMQLIAILSRAGIYFYFLVYILLKHVYRHGLLLFITLPYSTSKGRTIMVLFNVKQLIYKQQGEDVSTLFEQNGICLRR